MDQRLSGKTPMVTILRGLEPERAGEVGETLVEAGFEMIEVPLNSPDPFRSIEILVRRCGSRALIGAGTVLHPDQVNRLADIGAELVVSPNCDPQVIERTVKKGLLSFPGVLTPTEMFAALGAGANGLKIFPAEMISTATLRAVRAVLPTDVPVLVVGSIHAGNLSEYLAAGATGFGMGGSVFKPGKPLPDIARDAKAIIEAFNAANNG